MSADNYVVVKRFNKNNFGWRMYSASSDRPMGKWLKGFKTPIDAASHANLENYIEYGIKYHDNCLVQK